MHFSPVFFALSLAYASVASLITLDAPGASRLEARASCTPPTSPTPGAIDPPTFEPFDANTAQVYRYQKQVGANAGSMFVHEQWMDDSIFKCADGPKAAEIDIARGWGGVDGARQALEWHWDTWITEDYIQSLAGMGVNTIRMPIGFWSGGPDWTKGSIFEQYGAVYQNSWNRVLRTVSWCEKYKIGVLIDLHGAYGSQNGQAHSGVDDGNTQLFGNQENIQNTQKFLVWLGKQFDQVNNVVGIELLNEPKYGDDLLNFYTDTIPMVRAVTTLPIYLHDGFRLSNMASYVKSKQSGSDAGVIIIDNHSYYVFNSDDKSTSVDGLTSKVQSTTKDGLSSASSKVNGNLIVGEWGCALAPGSTHVGNLDSATASYCKAQMDTYESETAGWHFWSAKMSGCSQGDGNGWCFVGSVGKYLPSTFQAPSGQISAGGVVITGGSQQNATGNDNGGSSSSSNSNSTSSSADDQPSSSNSTSSDSQSSNSTSSDSQSPNSTSSDSQSSNSTSSDSQSSDSTSFDNQSSSSNTTSTNDSSSSDDSGDNSNSNSTTTTASTAHKKGAKSCKASNGKKSSSTTQRRSLEYRRQALSSHRRRHHARSVLKRAADLGYSEGHAAATRFARSGSKLGFAHAYLIERMVDLGLDREAHLEEFKRSFEFGKKEREDVIFGEK